MWAAIKCAAATGEVRPEDGALVFALGLSRWGTAAALSRLSVIKAIKHAEAEGLLEKLPRPDGARRDAPQPYALLPAKPAELQIFTIKGGSKEHDAQAAPSSKALPSSDAGGKGFSRCPGQPARNAAFAVVCAGPEGSPRGCARYAEGPPGCSHARRDDVRRIGKTRGAVIDHLERAGGEMGVEVLAGVIGYRRPGGLRAHLAVLENLGIVALDVDGDTAALEDRWRSALAEARELAEEPQVAERERAATRRRGEAWRAWRQRRSHRGAGAPGPTEAGRENVRRSRAARERHEPPPTRPRPTDAEKRRDELARQGMDPRFIGRTHRSAAAKPKPPPKPPPRTSVPLVGGVYVHGPGCRCEWCA